MRKVYFITTLTVCSVITAVPQGHRQQSNIPSDDRIVNNPFPERPSIPGTGIHIREEVRPGVSNQRHPQDTLRPQEINSTLSQGAIPWNHTFPSTIISSGNLPTQNSSSLRTPVSGTLPASGHDSILIERERHHCGIFPSPGECQAAFPRYYYNKTTGQCDCYLFGGCEEDIGSYRTFEECNQKCHPESKEEGPNCKLVFIDNFSPITPSTTLPTPNIFPTAVTMPHVPQQPGRPHNNTQSGRPTANMPIPGTFPNNSTSPHASRFPVDLPPIRRPAPLPIIPERPLSNTQSGRPIDNHPSIPSGSTFPHASHPSINHPVNRRPTPSPTNLLRPMPSGNGRPLENENTPMLSTDTSRRPPSPQKIPIGSFPLPGGLPINVPAGGRFVTMSSSHSRFPGESEEHEIDVFG